MSMRSVLRTCPPDCPDLVVSPSPAAMQDVCSRYSTSLRSWRDTLRCDECIEAEQAVEEAEC